MSRGDRTSDNCFVVILKSQIERSAVEYAVISTLFLMKIRYVSDRTKTRVLQKPLFVRATRISTSVDKH